MLADKGIVITPARYVFGTGSSPSSGPDAFDASGLRYFWVSCDQRQVQCRRSGGNQAIAALGNLVETLGDTNDLCRQWRFVVFAAGEGKARPLLKRKAQRHMTLAAGFSQLNESEGRDVDRAFVIISLLEESFGSLA